MHRINSKTRNTGRSGAALYAAASLLLFVSVHAVAQDVTLPASVIPSMSSPVDTQGVVLSATAGGQVANLWQLQAAFMLVHPSPWRGPYPLYFLQDAYAAPYVFEYVLPASVRVSRIWYHPPVVPADLGVTIADPSAFKLEARLNGAWQTLATLTVGRADQLVHSDFNAVTADALRVTMPSRISRSGGAAQYDIFGWLGINDEGTGDGSIPDPNPGEPEPPAEWNPSTTIEAISLIAARMDTAESTRKEQVAELVFHIKLACLLIAMTGGAVIQHVIWMAIRKGMI